MNKALLIILAVLLSLPVMSQSIVQSLDIAVRLKLNGDAHIHEVWKIDIGEDVKTEWYVAHYNMGEREIVNLRVMDNGIPLKTEENEWDIDSDKDEKAGKCGLVTREGGYEICWGVPTRAYHVYHVEYDIKGFVQSYSDQDGFGYWFADLNDNDPINSFRLTISAPTALSMANCRVWGFGYQGEAKLTQGIVVASSSGVIHKIGVLMSLGKGVLYPSLKGKGSFAELKEKAFKGSDFGGGSEGEPMPFYLIVILIALLSLFLIFIVVAIVVTLRRRHAARQLPYYKMVDASWSLLKAAKTLDDYDWYNKENLIGAIILKLISQGKVAIERTGETDKHGYKKIVLKIIATDTQMPEDEEKDSDSYICDYLLYIMARAAGCEVLLTSSKFEAWAEDHRKQWAKFNKALDIDAYDGELSEEAQRHLLGLRNYLHDIGKTGDRELTNINAWDDVIVYSYLFGFTEKLSKELRFISPSIVESSSLAQIVDDLYYYNPYFLYDLSTDVVSYSSNTSNDSSLGGGGGFSGGGGGGGR